MGTYTTNYQLYMPTIGEQGWGNLVNGNFTDIDTTMKSLSNRIATVESEINGALSCTSVATSGTITSTGLITGNGGIKGNLTGNVTGFLFVKGTVGTSGDENYATCATQTVEVTGWSSSSLTNVIPANYSIVYGNPKRHTFGVYTRRSDLSGTTSPTTSTRTIKVHVYAKVSMNSNTAFQARVNYKKSTDSSWTTLSSRIEGAHLQGDFLATLGTFSASVGSTYQFYIDSGSSNVTCKVEVVAGTTYKVKYTTP